MAKTHVNLVALGERIAEQAAHLDAAMHRLLADIRTFDIEAGWQHQGASSCAHWLSWRLGWTLGVAREHVRVARKLAELPQIADALRVGEMSYCKVRAMTRVATAANEDTLLVYARRTTGAQLEKICQKYGSVAQNARSARKPEDERHTRTVLRRDLGDGRVRIEATLSADEAAVVWAALTERAMHSKSSTSDVPAGTLAPRRFDRADALMELAQASVRGTRPQRSPIEVVVTIPVAALQSDTAGADPVMTVGCTADGGTLSAPVARRLCCDAGVVTLIEDAGGNPLSVGRKTRTIPSTIRRALLKRDATCRFPGCTNRLFLDGHHIQHWADGGKTSLENLVHLCSRHHKYVHEYGYRITMTADHEPAFFDSRGFPVHEVCDRPPTSELGWPHVRAANANADLAIGPETPSCGWDGRSVEYKWAVDGLLVADRRALEREDRELERHYAKYVTEFE